MRRVLCTSLAAWLLLVTADAARADSPTDLLIASLRRQADAGQLTDAELETIRASAAKGTLVNPIARDRAQTSAPLAVRHKELAQLIGAPGIQHEVVARALDQIIRGRTVATTAREKAETRTESPCREMRFVPVPLGVSDLPAWFGPRGRLVYPYEIQETPVTMAQYLQVMGKMPQGLLPSTGNHPIFSGRGGLRVNNVNDAIKEEIADRPLYGATSDEAIAFLDKMNSTTHDEPFYYDFPTDREWLHVALDGGRHLDKTGWKLRDPDMFLRAREEKGVRGQAPWGALNDQWSVCDYGWFQEELQIKGEEFPVASKRPFHINGRPVWDLMGGRKEVTWALDVVGGAFHGGIRWTGGGRRMKSTVEAMSPRARHQTFNLEPLESVITPWLRSRAGITCS